MTVKFKGPGVTKQNRLQLAPGVASAFEDEHAEDYFVRMGWAEVTDEEPVVTYPKGSVDIHPLTVFADGDKKGEYVHNERAQAFIKAQTQAQGGQV